MVSRAHAASGVLEHGFVYYMARTWADEMIEQCAELPNGDHDDMASTCIDAWLWLRRMYHLRMALEEKEETDGVDLSPRRLYG